MKFNNTIKHNPTVTSYEGGKLYEKKLDEDWANFLFSCMLSNKFYESSDKQMERYLELTEKMGAKYGSEFIAKAAMFARNEIGIRSIAQLTAALLSDCQFDGKRRFYKNFCARPDDVAEVFAATDMLNYKRSHAMVRGFGDYLSSLKPYQIDKYQMKGKQYNLFDCINICHAHSNAIDQYKAGTLEKAGTWEQKLSAAGDNKETKSAAWKELVLSGSLGYLAAIRNIRNILNECGDDAIVIAALCKLLENEKAILKSKIMPYQIYSAYKALGYNVRLDVHVALETAFKIATKNMKPLEGTSAILLDVSSSMDSRVSDNSDITLKECGAVYAMAILLANPQTKIVKFGNRAKTFKYKPNHTIFSSICELVENEDCGYGTDIGPAFNLLNQHYDRIFIISDMQIMKKFDYSWWGGGYNSGIDTYEQYVGRYGRCKCYSFDLANYRGQAANSSNPDVKLFTSLSSKVFDFIELYEQGGNLVDYINENYSF